MKLSKQKLMEIIKEELDDEWFGPPPGDLYTEADEAVLKVILDEWSQTYYLGNTSPLNQPESHHLGMPKEWKNNV